MNPEKGAEFATQLANDESGPLVDVERVVNIFMSQNMIQPATSFLLDALKENKQAVVICHILNNDYKKRRASRIAELILIRRAHYHSPSDLYLRGRFLIFMYITCLTVIHSDNLHNYVPK